MQCAALWTADLGIDHQCMIWQSRFLCSFLKRSYITAPEYKATCRLFLKRSLENIHLQYWFLWSFDKLSVGNVQFPKIVPIICWMIPSIKLSEYLVGLHTFTFRNKGQYKHYKHKIFNIAHSTMPLNFPLSMILQLGIANATSEVDRQEIVDKSINTLSNYCCQLWPVVASVAVAPHPILYCTQRCTAQSY